MPTVMTPQALWNKWKRTSRDHKSIIDGKRYVMTLDRKTQETVLVPLSVAAEARYSFSGLPDPYASERSNPPVSQFYGEVARSQQDVVWLSDLAKSALEAVMKQAGYTRWDGQEQLAVHLFQTEFSPIEWSRYLHIPLPLGNIGMPDNIDRPFLFQEMFYIYLGDPRSIQTFEILTNMVRGHRMEYKRLLHKLGYISYDEYKRPD